MTPLSTTVISADREERLRQFLKDLWDFRELFYTFLQRDLKVRYKQTALGAVWVVLQPITTTLAYVLVFGKIARMPTDGLPLVLFYFASNVPWNAFSRELTGCALSIEGNAQLVTKVYFPRIVIPGAIISASLVDFAIGWFILNLIAAWMGYWHWQLVAMTPLLLLIQWCTALGIGLALAALNAQYRDVKNVIGFFIQILMLATPVIYPISRLPLGLQPYLFLNPMAAVVTAYRDCLKGGPFNALLLGLSLLMGLFYLCIGFWFFRKQESRLADIL
jgi:lipopolysaccharide transport system permease protein